MRTAITVVSAALAATLPALCVAADPAAAPSASISGKLPANTALASAAGTRVTGVLDWSVRRDGNMMLIEAPESDARVAVVDLPASDAATAVKAAWARVGGKNATRIPVVMNPAPARSGWDERINAGYDIPDSEQQVASAIALRRGALWSVFIVDGNSGTLSKRGAAVSLMRASIVPQDYVPESFAGKKPHRLDPERIAQLRAFLEQALKDAGVPGAGFALLQDGKIIHEGGVGVRTLGKPTPVDAHTMFMAASNTKGMSTLLLATLADEGKLRWDQPVVQLYAPFKLGSPETTAQVQVRHLVCACTGLPRQDLEWIFEFRNATALSSMQLLGTNSPTSGFGEIFQYNNLMASAAGYVGAHLIHPTMEMGKAYDKAMQERIFTPLGMRSTTFDMARARRGNHATPHATGLDNVARVIGHDMNYSVVPHRPAGGVWTSAHDFIRYVQLEANAGMLPNGKQLVSAENLLMRRKGQVASGKDSSYGMGLENDRIAGVDVLTHGGSLFGYMSNFYLLPEAGIGAVLLTNSDSGDMLLDPFLRRLIEVLYDGKPEAAEDVRSSAARSNANRAAQAKLNTLPVDKAIAAKLGKRYRSAELGELTLRRQGKHLVADFGEWRSVLGSRKSDGGIESLLTTDAHLAGLEMTLGTFEGKRALIVNDSQHEYRFVEVR